MADIRYAYTSDGTRCPVPVSSNLDIMVLNELGAGFDLCGTKEQLMSMDKRLVDDDFDWDDEDLKVWTDD